MVALVLAVSVAPQAADATTPWLIPPVDGQIVRRFEAPGTEWGPGHRGIDLAVPAGTPVRAAAHGTVTFAGPVAGMVAVTIDHGGGLETTYSDLDAAFVVRGTAVEQGGLLGRSGETHDDMGHQGLHFGVKANGDYVDPESFLGPLETSSAVHLAPLVWEPPEFLPAAFREPLLSATAVEGCRASSELPDEPAPPNDNVAVLVAGIGSKTAGGTSAALYETDDLLGYPHGRVYRFSYRGADDPSLHEPYQSTDTFGDIRAAATRLRVMLRAVARRHPGSHVDLIAHSQGGIVARSYLELAADAWDRHLPIIDHLVTFATPHGGAPLAAAGPALDRSNVGRALVEAASWWTRRGGPIPDPLSAAVAQLAPGSELLAQLDREAVLYGTRVLTIAIPNDVIVPAERARWDGHALTVVPPRGLNGHDAVVTSRSARSAAHAFLRDAAPVCEGAWDLWGPRVGRAISFLEGVAPRLVGQ